MKNDQIQKINFLKQNRIEKNEVYKSCGPIYENFLRIGEIQFFSLSIIVKYSKIHRRNSPWTPPSLPPGLTENPGLRGTSGRTLPVVVPQRGTCGSPLGQKRSD